MSLTELMGVVTPPVRPKENGNEGSWQNLQKELNLVLPRDLFDFGLHYGTGRFCQRFLRVFNPFSKEYRNIIKVEVNALRLCKQLEVDLPYEAYPESPGLFPWGSDDSGNRMFWLTKGSPAEWPIILQWHENEYEQWDLPMTTFLARALSNKIKTLLWQKAFTKKQLVFEQVDY